MKKSIKMLLKVMPIVILALVFVSSSVFAIDVVEPVTGTASTEVSTFVGGIWSTVVVVVQVLAIAAIVIAGVRYMFASANDKADIKKQTVTLIVGAILVFAAVPVATLISDTANQIINK